FDERQRPRIVRRDSPHPWTDRERDLDDFVERRFAILGAKDAPVFSLFYGLKRRARIEDATASGTKDVPRHIENAESRAVQKSRNYIFLIELVLGGKGEGVDTAEITVRPILDELFDRAYRLRLRRLSQNSEEVFGFAGRFHVTIRLITVAVTVCLGKTESKRQMRQKKSGLLPTFDTIVSSSPPTL